MGVFNNNLLMSGGDADINRGAYGGGSYVFDNDAHASYSPSIDCDDNTYQVFYAEVKRHKLGTEQQIFGANDSSNREDTCHFNTDDTLEFFAHDAPATGFFARLVTTEVFRDTNNFMGICIIYDCENGTSTDTCRMYVRTGTTWRRITDFSVETYPTTGEGLLYWGEADDTQRIGARTQSVTGKARMTISKFINLDGITSVTDPTAFYETSSSTGKDVLKNYSGSFGTNGCLLDWNADRASSPDDASNVYDQSGNGNDWTLNSGDIDNYTNDTPVNNHATMNVLVQHQSGVAFSNGNKTLTITNGSTGNGLNASSLPIPDNQLTYCEATVASGGSGMIGLWDGINGDVNGHNLNTSGSEDYSCGYNIASGAMLAGDGTSTSYGSAASLPVTYALAVDRINNAFYVGTISGGTITWENSGDPESGATKTGAAPETGILTAAEKIFFACSRGGGMTITWNFGQDDWAASALPTDYVGLSSVNMPEPDIWDTTTIANVITETGDNIEAALSGDMQLIKDRETTEAWKVRFGHDSSNEYTMSTTTTYGAVASFSGSENHLGFDFNDDATNFLTGSVVVSGSDETISFSVPTARVMIWVFNRAGGEVFVYHPDNTSGELFYLTDTAADFASTAITSVSASGFTLDQSVIGNGTYDYAVFVDHDVFELFEYTGNANNDGALVPLRGIAKNFNYKVVAATGNAGQWNRVSDPYNVMENPMYYNTTNYEQVDSTYKMDSVSNGQKMRGTGEMNSANRRVGWAILEAGGQLAA